MDQQVRPGGVNVHALIERFSINAVTSCAYGLRGEAFNDPNAEFYKIGKSFMQPSFKKWLAHMCIILAPWLASFFKIGMTPIDVRKFFLRILKDASSYRLMNNIKENDYLQLLIQLKEKYSEANKNINEIWFNKFTDEDIAAQALTFFTDGYETSANALIYTLYQLALNPHVQEKLRDEITAGLENTEGEIITYEAIQELKYLHMVCEESLRKYPPITYMNRICTKPYDLPTVSGGTYRVEVGMSVVIPTLALHHDPQYYSEPDRFNPERFSEDNIQTRPKYVYFPFGGGPRICLGMRFGEALMKCGLVAILSSYDVMKMEKTPTALTHDPKAFFFAPNEEIWLDFKKRTS
ncbi:unnamed protein product [Timema podura]|uniref:Cytochrome P450 n=1 Tax=Timema podura TaxID=61482 RepID=A0ABN7NRA6_TIMPD|nr:unnamed protein product [Timema podura]